MRISTYTDYSLRLLMHAAARSPDLLTIDEVARGFGISKNHLMKVTHQLAQAGYLETQRGRSGGFRLARDASAINIGEIVRMGEKGAPLVECFDHSNNTCVITARCQLKFALDEAQKAFFDVLQRFTLKDLQLAPAEFLAMLHPPTSPG